PAGHPPASAAPGAARARRSRSSERPSGSAVSQETFDRIAGEYDESLPPHVVEHYLEKRVAFVRQHCPPGSGLDVGCGTGVLAERLAEGRGETTGLGPFHGSVRGP